MRSVILGVLFLAGSVPLRATLPEKADTDEPRYDSATEIHILATVTEVRDVPKDTPLGGIHLMVKTPTQAFDVYLGPAKFIQQFEIKFSKGDEVQVTGSKVKTANGVHLILARDVRKDQATLSCRRANGEPNWE